MERRKFLTTSTSMLTAAGMSGIATAEDSQRTDIEVSRDDDSYSKHITETDTYHIFKIVAAGEVYILKVNKQTGGTKRRHVGKPEEIQIAELPGTATGDERSVSVHAKVDPSEIDEPFKRADVYVRETGETCFEGCSHYISGISMEMGQFTGAVTKTLLAYEIISLVGALGSGSAIATFLTTGRIKAAISAVGLQTIEGNTFTIGVYDADVNSFWVKEQHKPGGVALGPWKPGRSALLTYMTLPGHIFC